MLTLYTNYASRVLNQNNNIYYIHKFKTHMKLIRSLNKHREKLIQSYFRRKVFQFPSIAHFNNIKTSGLQFLSMSLIHCNKLISMENLIFPEFP